MNDGVDAAVARTRGDWRSPRNNRPMTPDQALRRLVRDGRDAVREALARSLVTTAWEALQERDRDGIAKGVLPWTEEALAGFEAARQRDPGDVGLVHHLAIVHHSRAWELELAGDARAADAWQRALACWRTLAAAREFWAGLEAKLLALAPDADRSRLIDLRRDLLEHLLDIHVDFVRHYSESGAPERAASHIEIVRRAEIPPAIKKRLIDKVFNAMTGAVPDAKAAGAFDPALTTVERFLDLFPDHLAALRVYAEICHEWLSTLSYERWDEIVRLATRCEQRVRSLGNHPQLSTDPLGRTVLEDLTGELALRGHDRGQSRSYTPRTVDLTLIDRDAARASLDFAISWGRIGYPASPSGARIRRVFSECVNMLAISLDEEAPEVQSAAIDHRLKLATARTLYRRAADLLEEALDADPDNDTLGKNLTIVQDRLRELGAWPPAASMSVAKPPSPAAEAPAAVPAQSPTDGAAGARSKNPWRRDVLSQNPYVRTAFRTARVPREIVKRRTVVNLIGQTRQLIEGDPQAHAIRGRPVSSADVNAAQSILLDPSQRMREELLEHATERLPLDTARRLAQEALAAIEAHGDEPPEVTSLVGLMPWAERMVGGFLDASTGADPSFGALEMAVVPPCGDPAED